MTETDDVYDVAIIGGGASGCMAAVHAAERGKSVLVLEKNRMVGAKLSITGGGRCNIANNEQDTRTLLSHYGNAAPFLYSAFARFGLPETIHFFESRGMPLVTQARQRMFPVSEKAPDVTRLLQRTMQKSGVIVETNTPVASCQKNGETFTVTAKNGDVYHARALVIATGGTSHPETGSTGDGFRLAKSFGHTVVAPSPNIVPLKTAREDDVGSPGTELEFAL